MTIYLSQATKPKPKAPIITIIGYPGAGKTSIGSLFPKPFFIFSESKTSTFDEMPEDQKPHGFVLPPKPSKRGSLSIRKIVNGIVKELVTEDHEYKTLVVDSITKLNDLYEAEVVEFDESKIPPNNIEEAAGGFQKGYKVSASYHAELLRGAAALTRKGIAVVFLAHTGTFKIKNSPDDKSEYSTYNIDMHKHSRALYIEDSDAVFYLKKQENIIGHEENKKGQTVKTGRKIISGERILITTSDGTVGYVDAKKCWNSMPDELDVPFGENPILQYIPFFNEERRSNSVGS